jgi:hypothetical protein
MMVILVFIVITSDRPVVWQKLSEV